MGDFIRYDVRQRVAVITIDNPPVNALSPGVPEAIEEAVARAVADDHVEAIVLIGAGSKFVAGADIRIVRQLKTRAQSLERSAATHARWRRLEDSAKPIVAAIDGYALGGGLELAMACHYRVATATAQLGQPEVMLGIIPGAGGTQRLPRLCGAATALEMCTGGKPISAERALAEGLIDRVVSTSGEPSARREALLDDAIAFARARAAAGDVRRTRNLVDKIADRQAGLAACAAARAALPRAGPSLPRLAAAIKAIEGAFRLDFDEGSRRERRLFARCVTSTASRALVHLFFAEREVDKVPGVAKDTLTAPIARAAVIGAGTMGGGIAMCYASAGVPVLLKDVDAAALDRGVQTIRRNYASAASKGRMTTDALERAMALITPTTTFDRFDAVDIVVEAVFEDMELKLATFAELGRVTRPDCLLASNTSTLDIDALARASGRPAQVIGHHFFSPATVMKLLEIVRGQETSAETIATSLTLARHLAKIGVVVGNCFGFVANRMMAYYMREALLLLEEGADVSGIDGAMVRFGMPVGPFAMQDIAGIDVGWRIRQHLKAQGRTRADGPQSEVPDRLYEMGRYGQKTGIGWYRYEPGSRIPIVDPVVEEIAKQEAARRGVVRRTILDDEIIARITTALANEGARVLEEGHAIRAGDIDVIFCHGFGFPRDRGGPMFYADTVGLPTVLARVEEYRRRFGDYWKAAPLLERLAAANATFSESASAVSA